MRTATGIFILALIGVPAAAFDRQTTEALTACHDYVWNVPHFSSLPNAAISVFPGWENENQYVVFWNVYWDDPRVRRAGNCTIKDGSVDGFEDYTEMK